MVGDIGEILVAVSVVILLAGFLRYTFGSGPHGPLPATPDEEGDLGLLETVAVVPSREGAEILRAKLARERVRVTVSHGPDGWRLLAFPADVDDARLALRAL